MTGYDVQGPNDVLFDFQHTVVFYDGCLHLLTPLSTVVFRDGHRIVTGRVRRSETVLLG